VYTTAAGNERRSKCLYNGYRRFLPTTSLWRQRSFRWNGQVYWFPNVEQREWPKERTVQSAAECVVYARPKQPICGHKGLPFRWKWRGFRWLLSCCDLMHDIKCVCVATLKTIVGYVHDGCMYDSWKKDPRHRFECAVLGTFPEVTDTDNPLPWRLTRDELSIVNERVCNMWSSPYAPARKKRRVVLHQKQTMLEITRQDDDIYGHLTYCPQWFCPRRASGSTTTRVCATAFGGSSCILGRCNTARCPARVSGN